MSHGNSVAAGPYSRSRKLLSQPLTREPLLLRSGALVIIDQFMLANSHFLSEVRDATARLLRSGGRVDAKELGAALRTPVEAFGGALVRMDPVPSEVLRDPTRLVMVVCDDGTFEAFRHPERGQGGSGALFDAYLSRLSEFQTVGRVFVDTRCLVFVDALFFNDGETLERFQELREKGEEKAGRDLLRERGAAVRYGFQRYGDELGVYHLESENCLIIAPDVVDGFGKSTITR